MTGWDRTAQGRRADGDVPLRLGGCPDGSSHCGPPGSVATTSSPYDSYAPCSVCMTAWRGSDVHALALVGDRLTVVERGGVLWQ